MHTIGNAVANCKTADWPIDGTIQKSQKLTKIPSRGVVNYRVQ